jgi:hypothetical protein
VQSPQLQRALTDFVEQAAEYLQAQLSDGGEVPFELASSSGRRGRPALYSYRPLTERFIAERWRGLMNLDSYAAAARLAGTAHGLERYLMRRGVSRMPSSPTGCAQAALLALLEEVFAEQSDFEIRAERLNDALDSLQGAGGERPLQVTVLAALRGIILSSAELPLTNGLSLIRSDDLQDAPEQTLVSAQGQPQLLAVFTSEETDVQDAVQEGRAVLCELLRALRLFGDGRIALSELGWTRVGRGSWKALALPGGGHPHGMLLIAPEQEDELRAFCNLVSRRTPEGNELGWALERFHMGCERQSEQEALTDHLMALRVLLEPEGPTSGMLAGRLAALCSTPDRRAWLTERVTRALALERSVIAGTALHNAASEDLVRSIAGHLRALLRDVICGHLDPDLTLLADELLSPSAEQDQPQPLDQLDLVEALAVSGSAREDAVSVEAQQKSLWEQQSQMLSAGF